MSGVGAFGRLVSRQAAHPSGLFGKIIGGLWVWETAAVNDAVLAVVGPQPGETVLEIGHDPGKLLSRILSTGTNAAGAEVSETMMRQPHRRNRHHNPTGAQRRVRRRGNTNPTKGATK